MASTPFMSPEEIERLARKRAGAKMGWLIHATVYVAVNLLLFAFSELGFGRRPWSLATPLVWGLGLTVHGASVWLLETGGRLHQRLVQHERERLQRTQNDETQP